MAALPIDQSEMVSESQLSELAQVLTVGILENDVLLFADYQMEMMRELCIFLQGVHVDSKQNSEDLARAVCALSVLRVHLKDKENNPLKDVKYDPFSRYLPGVPVRSMAQKLRTFSRPLLLKKHHEIITYAAYMEPRMAGLGSSQAWRKILHAAHVLILDAYFHLYLEGPFEENPTSVIELRRQA